jgi:hypothetical protein
MRNPVEIEDIEDLRRREGIDDAELRETVRGLAGGDLVRLTLLPAGMKGGTGETLLVRITSIRDSVFRGKLVDRPTSPGLSNLEVGSVLVFTATHIHSVPKGAAGPSRLRRRPRRAPWGESLGS